MANVQTQTFNQQVNGNLKVLANYQPQGQLGNGTFEWSDVGAVARNLGGSLVGGVLSTAESLSDPVMAAYYTVTGQHSKARDTYLNSWSQTATDYLRGDDKGGETMQFFNNIAQGVGEQGTRLAIAIGLAHIAAPLAISAGAINTGLLAASSFGSGMQNAVQTTGELGLKEHIYGIGSALIELGTEKLSDVAGLYGGSSKTIGGMLNVLDVDGWTSKLLGQYANTVGGKLARTFAGEFGEEALSELLNVPLSKLTIDENASTSLKDVLSAGLQGGIVGAIMGGGQEVLNKSNYTKKGQQYVENSKSAQQLIEEGKEVGNEYATYLQNRLNAGAEVSATQYGKLAYENEVKIMQSEVANIKEKYDLTEKEAQKKYYNELAAEIEYLSNGASAFLTEATNTPENISAIDEYVNRGGSLDNLEVASRIASRRGNVVNYVYDPKSVEGQTESGNVVTINLASDKFIGKVAIHEALHTLGEDKTSKMYEAIKTTDWHKENAEKISKQYEEAYKDRANKDALIREEIVARYMEQAINNPRAFLKSLEGKSGIADEIIAYFKGYNKYTKNLSKADKKALNFVYNEYLNALKEEKSEKRRITSTMYDLKKPYKEQVADYLENGTDKEYLFVGNATEQLKRLGNNDSAVLVAPSVIDKAKEKHGLSDAVILKLDDMIKKPLMIMKSLTEENSLVFFSEEEVDGDNVIVAINTQSKDGFRIINRVMSFYPKQPAADFVKKSLKNILWIDKKSGQQWLHSRGLQLPNENTIDDRGYIVHKENSNVNSFDEENTNVKKKSSTKKYSLPENAEEEVIKHFGTTYNWNETGYITTDGRRIDFSGKNDGAPGGYRTVDHRDVADVFEGMDGNEAMIAFMQRGNIRVMPETPGINVQVEPTETQYKKIEDFISRYGWRDGYFSVDFDDANGNTVGTLEYYNHMSSRKVVDDIKKYFKDRKLPYQSDLSQFKYSLREDNGEKYVDVNTAQDIFEGKNKAEMRTIARQYIRESLQGKKIDKVVINKRSAEEYTYSKYSELLYRKNKEIFEAKMKASTELEAFIAAGKYLGHEEAIHSHSYNKGGYDRFEVRFVVDKVGFNGEMLIAINENGDGAFYDIVEIKESGIPGSRKKITADTETASNNHYTQENAKVKGFDKKYSINDITYDEEAFADSRPPVVEKKDPRSQKIYTKKEAKDIIDEVLREELGGAYGLEFEGGKGALITRLQEAFNKTPEGNKLGAAMDIAEYIIERTVLDETDYDVLSYNTERLEAFKGYRFNLNGIKKEIKYRYDKAYPSIMKNWHSANGLAMDTLPDSEEFSISLGLSSDSWNEAELFFEFYDEYTRLKKAVKEKATQSARELFSDGEYRVITENIANKLVEGYDLKGKKDALTTQRDINAALKAEIKELSKKIRYAEAEKNVSMQIQSLTQSAKEFAKRKYSSQAFSGEEAQAVNTAFSKVVVRNKVNTENAIRAVMVAKNFYTPERINGTTERETFGLYNQGVADDIDYLLQTLEEGKNITVDELKTLNRVMKAVTHIFRNIDTIIYNGKRTNTAEVATQIITEQRALPKTGKFFKGLRFGITNACDPLAVFNFYNGYHDDATLLKLYNDIRDGETTMVATQLEILRPFNEFAEKHKKYEKRLGTATVELEVTDKANGGESKQNISLDIAMQLYLTAKREHAKSGLFEAGFTYTDKNGSHRLVATEAAIKDMYDSFTAEDIEFLDLTHTFFNETCRDIKVAKDIELFGFTNIEDGDNYIPIRRDDGIFTRDFSMAYAMRDFQTVNSLSMNKSTVKGTKSAIAMQGLWQTITMHAKQISLYNGLYQPIMAFTNVWNRNITGNSADVDSVKVAIKDRTGDNSFDIYVSDLLKGIQGNSKVPQSKVISWLRSSYAKFQLGANLKTMAIQTSSYPMAMLYIKPKYLLKAAKPTLKKAQVYKYCPFLEVRATDNQLAKAQGVIDDVKGFGDILLKPIGVVDDAMTRRIFEAACYEVAESSRREVFSDENMKEAAKLTEKTVRETQANALTSEKTAMMRSGSDLIKSLVMFSSDASKQLSRMVDAIGYYDTAKRSGDKAALKAAKEQLNRCMGTVTTSVAACTLIGLLVKHALGRDDDEKTFMQEYFNDFFGQWTGMIPVLRDTYNFFSDGYEVSNFAVDSVNNIYSGVNSSIKTLNRTINGETLTDDEIVAPLKKVIFAAGQISGIPTRNLINQPTYFVKKWFLQDDKKQQEALFGNAFDTDMFTVKK